jgi:hypothetical protein
MKNITLTQLSKLCLLATILVAINFNSFAGMETATRPNMIHAGFIKNAGQVYDMNGKLCPDVLYSLQLNGMAVFITKNGFTYCMAKMKDAPDDGGTDLLKKKLPTPKVFSEIARMDMNLLGAEIRRENCIEEKTDDTKGLVNYYGGGLDESARNLHYVTQIRLQNIYPGIDWLVKVDAEKGLKADYIVQPGADASLIKMEFKGTTSLSLSAPGDFITAVTPLETFNIGKLDCFTSDNKLVKANYILKDNIVSVAHGKYNLSKALVIDPTVQLQLAWQTYFGGALSDQITACCVDEHYNFLYFVGHSTSFPFPPLSPYSSSYYWQTNSPTTNTDAFIFKTDYVGANLWCTFILSTEDDGATDVTTDNRGNVYMMGSTGSLPSSTIQFPIAGTSWPINFNHGGQDAFIAKFDFTGKLMVSTEIGNTVKTPSNDIITAVAFDKHNNNLWVCGTTQYDPTTPLTPNFQIWPSSGNYNNSTYNAPPSYNSTGFIAQIKSDPNTPTVFNPLWSSLIPVEFQLDIAYDERNNRVYSVGEVDPFLNTTFSTYGTGAAYQQNYLGWDEGTIWAFDGTTDNKIWITYFGCSGDDQITSCTVSEDDYRLYICGNVSLFPTSTNFPITPTPSNPNTYYDPTLTITGGIHGYIAAFNTDFSQAWCTYFQATNNAYNVNRHISAGKGGNIFITGNYYQSNPNGVNNFPPVTSGNPGSPFYYDNQGTNNGQFRPYIAMFTPGDWQLYWCTFYGYVDQNSTPQYNSGNEIPSDIAVGGDYLLWAGNTRNFPYVSDLTPIPETGSSYQQNSTQNSQDGMIAKFNNLGPGALRYANQNNGVLTEVKYEVVKNLREELYIETRNNDLKNKITKVVLYDTEGRIITNKNDINSYQTVLKLPQLSKGLYLLEVTGNNGTESFKIVY